MLFREAGEKEVVERVRALLSIPPDDAACLRVPEGVLVVTTDMLHLESDFPVGMSPWEMGWTSVAVSLSDLAAMGASPVGLVMAVGVSGDWKVDSILELVRGMQDCASVFGTRILGGDLDRHREVTLVGTGFGLAERPVHRWGARPGEVVAVTGRLGVAGAALAALERGEPVDEEMLKRLFQPHPRVKEGVALSGIVSSMTDVSDGLAISLHELASAGRVGFKIRENEVPVQNGGIEFALYSGGDYELLFTLDPGRVEEARGVCDFTVIGEVTPEVGGVVMETQGGVIEVENRGYEHR